MALFRRGRPAKHGCAVATPIRTIQVDVTPSGRRRRPDGLVDERELTGQLIQALAHGLQRESERLQGGLRLRVLIGSDGD